MKTPMMTGATSTVGQLRAARALFQEALRTRSLVAEESLGLQLQTLGSEPTSETLHTWLRAFRVALPAHSPVELLASAEALELELGGNLLGALLVLGGLLVARQRLERGEVDEAAAELGAEPTPEALRVVLQSWIHRGAAWGGPILGQMRDFYARIEESHG
jgi:hypothetical protein